MHATASVTILISNNELHACCHCTATIQSSLLSLVGALFAYWIIDRQWTLLLMTTCLCPRCEAPDGSPGKESMRLRLKRRRWGNVRWGMQHTLAYWSLTPLTLTPSACWGPCERLVRGWAASSASPTRSHSSGAPGACPASRRGAESRTQRWISSLDI